MSCVLIKKLEIGFPIIIVYVDNLNLIETPKELKRTTHYLKTNFEMKNLVKIKFSLDL